MKIAIQSPFFARKTVLATALAAMTAPSYAQDLALEEVIVTAQKREQSVQDIPSSVSAFSSEMLEKSNTRNFSDLGQIASGVNVTPSADGFGAVIKIRGVGNNAFAPAIRPAVGIFLDDIPLGSTEAAYNNLADVERIEVLKGPQSTLFGKEVSAGAISLFTKRPDPTGTDGYIEGNFGNNGLMEYRLGGNLPLGDTMAVRASIYDNSKDATIKNTALENDGEIGTQVDGKRADDGPELDALGYRLRFLWEPTENFSAILGYEDHETDFDGASAVAKEYGDAMFAWERDIAGITDPEESRLKKPDVFSGRGGAAGPTARNTNTEIWSLHLDWAINDQWTLTSVTSDQDYSLETTGTDNSDFIDSNGDYVRTSFSITTAPYKITSVIQDQGTDTFTQELRLTFENDDWSSIFGAFYAETDLVSDVPLAFFTDVLFGGAVVVYAPTLSYIQDDTTEWALFTHNIWSIREGLDLTFGLRYSDVEKEALKGQLRGEVGAFADYAHPLVPTTQWDLTHPDLKRKDNWDEVTGTIKVTYWLNDEMSVYGGWDRGFKAGGHDVCKDTGEPDPYCPEPFDSEVADNFEVGLKGRFFDNTLVWNVAAFYQMYDDYQVDVQDDQGPGNRILNAASVEISGFETDFQWLAGEHLLLDGNLAYVDARWDDFEDAECVRPQYSAVVCTPNEDGIPKQDLSGKRLNYTSPWTANLNATWNDEFNNGIGWYLRGEVVFRDDRYFSPDLDPAMTDGSYTVFNASLGITGEGLNWDIIFWAKNITETEYLNTASRARDNGALPQITGRPQVEGFRVEPTWERSYGMTLKYRFGDF